MSTSSGDRGSNFYKHDARKYCSVCKIWIQNDLKSIRGHESGGRHKFNLRKKISESEKQEEKQRKKEAFVRRELERVDKLVSGTAHPPTNATYPLKCASRTAPNASSHSSNYGKETSTDDDPYEITVVADQVLGQYNTNGCIYLEGNLHEDLLSPGRRCQAIRRIRNGNEFNQGIFEDETWCDCEILSVVDLVKKDSQNIGRQFAVRFTGECPKPGDSGIKVEQVESRDIRVLGPPPPYSSVGFSSADNIGDSTSGNSEWSTVAVRIVPQEDDQIVGTSNDSRIIDTSSNSDKVASLYANRGNDLPFSTTKLDSRTTHSDDNDLLHSSRSDALSTFMPFGGDYKGVNIRENTVEEQIQMNTCKEEPVGSILSSTVGSAPKLKFRKRTRKRG